MSERHTLRGYLCAGGGAVIWGLTGTVGQYLIHHYAMDPFWIASVRLSCAGLLLMLLAAPQYRVMQSLLRSRRNVLALFSYAIFGLLMSQTAFYVTIEYSNSGTAAVLQTLCVVMMAVLVCLHGHRLPTPAEAASVVLALAGVFLIATGGRPDTMIISPQGLFWGLADAVACILYTVIPHRQIQRWGTLPVNGLGMFIGGLVLSLFLQPWQLSLSLDLAGILAIAFIVLIGTVASFTLFLRGVGDIGPVKATFIGTLEPVSATVSSLIFLGTPFTGTDFIGFFCILATVYIITMKSNT